MDSTVKEEIRRLKKDLSKRKEEIRDIRELVQKEIDREYDLDPEGLSERELETYIRESLLVLKKSTDTAPDPKTLRSHRRILGRPILFFKRAYMKMIRFYTGLLVAKQTRFNELSSSLLQALVIRSRREREKQKEIEEKISRCEEHLVLLMARLRDLQAKGEQSKHLGSASGGQPAEKE